MCKASQSISEAFAKRHCVAFASRARATVSNRNDGAGDGDFLGVTSDMKAWHTHKQEFMMRWRHRMRQL